METVKHVSEGILLTVLHWVYVHLDYVIGIPLAVFCYKASGWGTATLNLLARISLGVGVALLSAFAVTVYKVLLEEKVSKWLKKKKDKKEKSEAQE